MTNESDPDARPSNFVPPSPEETRRLLCALGDHGFDLGVTERGRDMAAVAGETVADTM